MSTSRVARRYAEALLGAAVEARTDERIAADLDAIDATLRHSRELVAVLKSPVIKRELKQSALKAIFGGTADPLTMAFLEFLAEKGREAALADVIVAFRRLRDERLGIMTVDVEAATDLTPDQQTALRQRLESLTRKNIRFAIRIDRSLKGGFRARVGDTVYDGTLRRQLEILRRRFAEGGSIN